MQTPREIRLNAFDMACIGHIQQGMWTHPRDRAVDYLSLDHWTGLARLLERGLFDGLFLADVLGVYDVHGGSQDAAVRHGVQIPLLDPMLLVPAMAAVTQHLGFGVTVNLAWEPPALLARRFSTLDHLTRGRIGWNIVTGYLDSAARAMGLDRQMAHDDRYDMADEFMQVAYRLWEESWAADAVKRDRDTGVYADPSRVARIRHEGRQYRLDAPHLVEPSPQRTPVLYQAGASDRGRAFAARHAECVFLNGGPKPHVASLVADLRARAAPRPIKAFMGATLIIGRTAAEARDRLEDYRRHASVEAALVHASASLGIDLARLGMDDELPAAPSEAIRSNVEALRAAAPRATKRALIDRMILGSRQPPILGSAEEVADALIAWVDEADIDGFNLSRTVIPECLEDVVTLLVPVLQERGRYKRGYAPGTYREKLFGAGPRLAAPHPAAAVAR
ncbi:LLM class flavin-dependent oxidoreductase [Roseomonas eburnea]|uniref:LLM class flavin-dependent oxidoreductase n=1 Tax=Neoroseomonas eburnea TaxID=1346889 RepID=A0A9X9XFA8_9PROT|nr:LLM class flavin-dependent oxidoreductase [Neoroseomonas eburnea]MBR0682394.1 LLM class flavin-dependent oxidoreductase [Neoroseomonas eburnea]